MKKSILLTGASGFLGQILFENLSILNNIYSLSRKNATYVCDLTKNIPNFNIPFDIVIHAAGIAHNKIGKKNNFASIYESNILITNNLLSALNNTSIKQFVFISSVSVYGLFNGDNINEEQPLNAKDEYGLSKIHCEKIITDWCLLNNVKLTILRLPLVVGKNPPGNLGSMIRSIKSSYYFNINGGSEKKSMVLGSDVAHYILKASFIGGVFNLTDRYHPSFKELSFIISKSLGKKYVPNLPLWLAKLVAQLGDYLGDWFPINSIRLKKITSSLTFDDDKAKNMFEWNPTPVLSFFNRFYQ